MSVTDPFVNIHTFTLYLMTLFQDGRLSEELLDGFTVFVSCPVFSYSSTISFTRYEPVFDYSDVLLAILVPKYTLNCCQGNTPRVLCRNAHRTEGRSELSSL